MLVHCKVSHACIAGLFFKSKPQLRFGLRGARSQLVVVFINGPLKPKDDRGAEGRNRQVAGRRAALAAMA